MRVSVTVLDDHGRSFGGEANLQAIQMDSDVMQTAEGPSPMVRSLDFDLPMRPFMKRYGSDLSGPKRFALLLAHSVRGAAGASCQLGELEKFWNSMIGIMGGTFNSAYPTRAKDNGWVNSPRTGVYVLLPGWTEIF